MALAVLAVPVLAQESGDDETFTEAEEVTGKLEPFDAIDYNNDDHLSWEEIRNQVVRIFLETDLNGDNHLTKEEFSYGDRHFILSDINNNELVELQELQAHAAIIFGAADTDGDDMLSRKEAETAKKAEGL